VKTRFHSYFYIFKNNENVLNLENECTIMKNNLIFDHLSKKNQSTIFYDKLCYYIMPNFQIDQHFF
jgi:hypothetical protein